jgi:uncharacterized protein
MNMFDFTVPQLKHTLTNLDRWLTRAGEHATAKEIPEDKLLGSRLAADQFPLVRQVQVATDNAKFVPGRLTAKDWPSHPDTETSIAQLHARIASVQTYLDSFGPADFEGAAERNIVLPWMAKGQHLTAPDYVVQFALPNFYFHVVTAYSIMRHVGVSLGKMDYIGPIAVKQA